MQKKKLRALSLVTAFAVTLSATACSAPANTGGADNAGQEETADSSKSGQSDEKASDSSGDKGELPEVEEVLKDLSTEWDLTELYADEDAFNSDMDYVTDHLSDVEKYKGTLNSAENILALTEDKDIKIIDEICNKSAMYTEFLTSLDASDKWAKQVSAKYSDVASKYSMAQSFIEPEIMSLSLEERQKIFSDESLKPYAYFFKKYTDPDYVSLSEESSKVETLLNTAADQSNKAYTVFDNVDLKRPEITMPDGSTETLTDELYTDITTDPEYTHEFRKEASNTRDAMRAPYANTYAEMLAGEMKRNWAEAQIHGFDSTLEYMCYREDIDPEIYNKVIEFSHSLLPKFQEYYASKKKILNLDEIGVYDMYLPVSSYIVPEVDYEYSVNLGRDAIKIWGSEYLDRFDEIMKSKHIDVYPAENKSSGAYEYLVGQETLPFVFYNFDDQLSYTSTIVHEMGHAVYSEFSAENQNPYNCSPIIFTQEVASTANELMLYKKMVENSKTDEEKLYWVNKEIDLFASTIFRQCLYSEFEDYCYKTIEAGDALSAENMNAKWLDLCREYYGDGVTLEESNGVDWCRIPHMYYGYYVYKYASSLTYSTAICNKAVNDDKEISSYIKFLKAGNSESPADLLKIANVDPFDSATYDSAGEYIGSLIDEFASLAK